MSKLSICIANIYNMCYDVIGDVMVYYIYCDNDLRLEHLKDEKPQQNIFYMHTHDFLELYIFLNGKGVYHVEGNHYPLIAGDILIMRKNEAHYIEISEEVPYERIFIHFSDSIFSSFDTNNELLSIFFDRISGTDNLYRKEKFSKHIYSLNIDRLINNPNKSKLQITTSLISLLYEMKKIREHNTPNKDRDYPISHQILNYINQHLFDDISLDNLAEKFFISKTTLIRIIKNSTGSTPWNYITIKRLNCAKTMLENGHSPNEVCFSCGYKDYSSFFRAYKKHFSTFPRFKQKNNI